MIEEVRARTETMVSLSCYADDPVLIEAPPASGKTYTAIRLAAQGHKVLYLAGRTDLYEQAKDEVEALKAEADEADITAETIPSPNRHCDTFQGENSGDTRKARRLYAKGVSGRELHTDQHAVSMPCHTEGSPCEYVEKRENLGKNRGGIDIIIGNHQHAYDPRYQFDRVVVFDEFNPDPFIEPFPSGTESVIDDPTELVSAFLAGVDGIPLENITDLIEARVRKGEDYRESREWFQEHGASEKTVKKTLGITSAQYNTAHKRSAFLTAALLEMEQVGPDMELAYEPELWEELGVRSGLRCVRNRSTGEMFVLEPPPLEDAKQVIGLDAVPVPRMWNAVFDCEFEKREVLEREKMDRYLREGLGIDVVQVTESRHPYSGGRISGRDKQRFAFVRSVEGQKFPVISRKRALEAYRSREWFEKCIEAGEKGSGGYRMQNYGSVLSSNTFESDLLGFISGSPYPGDDVVKRWCAFCGEAARPVRNETPESGQTLEFGTELGERIYRHFTHDLVFQAILRFGRTPDNSADRSTVYVNTSAVPDWISPRQVRIYDWYNAAKRIAVVEELIRASVSPDRQNWQTISSLQDPITERLEATGAVDDTINKEWIREVLQDEELGGQIERDPGAGWNGATLFRWDGNGALYETSGIVNAADHVVVTDGYVMFVKIAGRSFE